MESQWSVVGGLFCMCMFAVFSVAHAEPPPNIVVILADDLGYGDLACYGHPRNQTPHIDALAREGLRFTDFHSNGPMCSPTRAALLTGLYQNRFGRAFETALSAKEPEVGLPVGAVTIPQILKPAGYVSALYGKWHLGYRTPHLPNDFAFDDFRGLLTGDGDHVSRISRSGTPDWYHNKIPVQEDGYTAELITRYSIDFIRRHRDRPFFLFVSHLAIHFPWQAPGEAPHRVPGRDYWNLQKLGPHSEGEVGPVVRAMVESVDRSVGEIIAALRASDIDERTLVFFTSDNGGYLDYGGQFVGEISSNGPYRGQKTEVWEGGHRVPAIAWWPGTIEAGSVSHDATMTVDLLPTVAEFAGVDLASAVDGISLAPHMVDGKAIPERDLFWRADEDWAVRRGSWKLVGLDQSIQLYNLDEDPGETLDVSAEQPQLVDKLRAVFRHWEVSIGN